MIRREAKTAILMSFSASFIFIAFIPILLITINNLEDQFRQDFAEATVTYSSLFIQHLLELCGFLVAGAEDDEYEHGKKKSEKG